MKKGLRIVKKASDIVVAAEEINAALAWIISK